MLSVARRLFVVGYVFAVCCMLFDCSLFVVCRSVCVKRCLLRAVYCVMFVVKCLLFVAGVVFVVWCLLCVVCCLLLIVK